MYIIETVALLDVPLPRAFTIHDLHVPLDVRLPEMRPTTTTNQDCNNL